MYVAATVRRLWGQAPSPILIVAAPGCLIIPTDYYSAGVRHNIKPDEELVLQRGVTTKEEVFLALGEPDYASEDGRQVGYAWRKVKAFWILVSTSGGASGEVEKSYLLRVEFDVGNRVTKVERLERWGDRAPVPVLDQHGAKR